MNIDEYTLILSIILKRIKMFTDVLPPVAISPDKGENQYM